MYLKALLFFQTLEANVLLPGEDCLAFHSGPIPVGRSRQALQDGFWPYKTMQFISFENCFPMAIGRNHARNRPLSVLSDGRGQGGRQDTEM